MPEWIVIPLLEDGVSDSDYYLYGAGRALGFVRMAGDQLDDSTTLFKEAEYHTYTGISASRTAIDAAAAWLNARLELKVSPPVDINLSRKPFREKVSQAVPQVQGYLEALGNLGQTIDEHRQRAQHREGLAIEHQISSAETSHLSGWYIRPNGIGGPHDNDQRLAELLQSWAEKIEFNLRGIHRQLSPNQSQPQ